MELLVPAIKTFDLDQTDLGDYIAFVDDQRLRHGFVCQAPRNKNTPQWVEDQGTERWVVELSPGRRLRSGEQIPSGAVTMGPVKIDLSYDEETMFFDGEQEGGNHLVMDGDQLMAPVLVLRSAHTPVESLLYDMSTGIQVSSLSNQAVWFKYWRILVPVGNTQHVLFDSKLV